jgi:cob(I)alamin adenosyltransferase
VSLKIYTKTGDKGKTSLIGGTKVPKNHQRIEAYGTVDELNAFIGLLNDSINNVDTRLLLKEIQDRLFTIGSTLATDPKKKVSMKIPALEEGDVLLLEQKMDEMNEVLPPMKSFILPGGHPTVSIAHICRTVCRRAERSCVSLLETSTTIDPLVIKYLNRLSDYFFVLARWLSHTLKAAEVVWKPRV